MASSFPFRSTSSLSAEMQIDDDDDEMGQSSHFSDYENDDNYEYAHSDNGDDDEYEYEYTDDDGSEVSQESSQESSALVEKQREISIGYNDGAIMMKAVDLVPVMLRRAESITEVLNIPTDAALPCLRKFRWDKQRLMQSYVNDSKKLTIDAGVYHRCNATATTCATPDNNTQHTCQICFDDFLKDEMHAMPCNHFFCVDCWRGYLSVQIDEGPACIGTSCPDIKCKELVTETEVKKMVPNLLDKFVSYQLRNFIEDRSTSRWCPGPDCKYIATLPGTQTLSAHGLSVFCRECNTSFCLGCGDDPHAPLTCKDVSTWKENYETTGSESWILENTKPCPNCRVRIEKNQGCNHMTCNQCHHEFCWICNADWKEHNQCNRFDASATVQGKERELARNLHYVKRYQIHGEAQKFAQKEVERLRQKWKNSTFCIEEGETLAMVEEMKEPAIRAMEELVECRRTLKNTYIFAFHNLHKIESNTSDEKNQAKTKIMTEQFEYHQEMLERFTEELSGLTEKPLKDIAKLEIVNKAEGVRRFRNGIVSYVLDEMYELS